MKPTMQAMRLLLLTLMCSSVLCKEVMSSQRKHTLSQQALHSQTLVQGDMLDLVKIEKEKTVHKMNKARSTLVLCSLIYGSSYIITKKLQSLISSELINFIRFLLASTCFAKDIILFRGSWRVITIGVELGFWCGTGFMFQTASLKFAAASKAALFTSVGVMLPPIFDTVHNFVRERGSIRGTDWEYINHIQQSKQQSHHRKQPSFFSFILQLTRSPYFSPFLTIIGALIIEWGGMDSPSWQDLILLVPPCCFATTFWRASKTATQYPQHTSTITGIMLLTTAFMSGIWALLKQRLPLSIAEWTPVLHILTNNKYRILGTLFLGVIATGWTAIREQHVLKVLSAREATLIYTLEPVFAAAFASAFLGEHLGWNTVIGAVLISGACILH